MCVPSDYISSSCPERRHRGTLMVGRSSNSLNLLRALMVRSSCNISSRSNPEINILCSKILARTTNGVANPRGSNSLTIFMRKFRFIRYIFTLKVFSFSGDHKTPRIFTDGIGSLARQTSADLVLVGILSRTLEKFENHLWAYIPSLA